MKKTRIITWNVNGIRAAVKKHFLNQYRDFDADVFCLQETKAQDDQFAEAVSSIADHFRVHNAAERKGYSSTAVICKKAPENHSIDIGIDEHDMEGRVIMTDHGSFILINVYVPNSGSGLKRIDYRAQWDVAFADYIASCQKIKPVVVTGDLNVAHAEIDLARAKENYNKTSGYTQREIDGLQGILDLGLLDAYRFLYPEKIQYTYWNQRFRARDRNVGWRIDYFLVDQRIEGNIKDCIIHDQTLGSDHCPVELVLDI